ncbi:hypothetical protein [Kibdelosporangium philippinense]|uniref:hypothetical protein n=1 Tax=Kibdelosporangium philippinense TaxID=211113 RepID=UPI003605B7E7
MPRRVRRPSRRPSFPLAVPVKGTGTPGTGTFARHTQRKPGSAEYDQQPSEANH